MGKSNRNQTNTLVFSPYYPPHAGGVENYTQELCEKLGGKGINSTIFTPLIPMDTQPLEDSSPHVSIIRFPAFEIIPNFPLPKFWSPRFWKLYFSFFSKQHFDTTISHTRFFSTSLLAFIFAKAKKVRWIHIEHGSDFVQSNNFFVSACARLYDATIGKMILRHADQIVAISESVKSFVQKLAPAANCEVIYRGFDFKGFEQIEPNRLLREKYPSSVLIMFIGRLISGKGVSDLLQALAGLKNEPFCCLIIGDGSERKNLEETTRRLGIENKVVFFGQKPHPETMAILKASDIFVNPSYTEGLPTTVVEAALCEKAVVATNVGGTGEIINDNKSGFLIEPRNPKKLQIKLGELIKSQSLRTKFSENALAEVIEKFDSDRSLEQILQLIKIRK